MWLNLQKKKKNTGKREALVFRLSHSKRLTSTQSCEASQKLNYAQGKNVLKVSRTGNSIGASTRSIIPFLSDRFRYNHMNVTLCYGIEIGTLPKKLLNPRYKVNFT